MRVAEQTIDQLNIEINAKAKQGGSGMDKLIASIEKLKSVTGGGAGNLSGIAGSIKKLTDAIDGAKSKSGTLSSLARSIEKLNEIKTTQISGNLTALVDSLKVLNGMDSGLKVIISDLATLAKSGTGGISGNALKLQAEAAKAQATIDKSALTSAKAQEGLKAIEEKNRKIADSARFAAEAQDSLASAVARAVKASQTGEVSDYVQSSVPITKKSTPSASFMPYDINSSIKDLQTALDGAGSTASKVTENISTGSNKASGAVGRLKEMFKSAKAQAADFGKSANTAFRTINFAGAYMLMRRGANMIGGFINNINSYIESMNLFTVSMGDAADEGSKLAHSMQDILGIDAGEASKYMGIFQQLETSFGVVNSQATTVSKNLTQLGYDIASYFNISTENSFLKLQSGLAGEVEPLRRIGFDISKARLQQELYRLGIDATVDSLSQADKSLLRYIAIMRQSTNVQGDMARTLSAPSNQLRILTAQLQIAGRAIGSIFIPMLNAVLPPIIAFVQLVGEAAAALAAFFGFKMPKVEFGSAGADLSGLADDAEDFASGVGDIGDSASDAAKEVRDLIGGFDELNILRADDGSSGKNKSGAGGAGGNILGGIELPEYNMLEGAIDSRIAAFKARIQKNLADITAIVSGALIAVGAILLLTGANIPLGLGLMAVGAIGLASTIMANWATMTTPLLGVLTTITTAVGGFLLALGAILAFSGANVPLGIGLMVAGAVSLAAAVAINWNSSKSGISTALSGITGLVSGATLALGALFALTGVDVPLGIGLMLVGAVGIASSVALNWSGMSDKTKETVSKITGIVSGALLALGAILTLTGAAPALGIPMMAVGAAVLATTVAVNWNTMSDKLRVTLTAITSIVGVSLLALGAILAFTGVGIPLGIGMMVAGAAGLATAAGLNWDYLKTKLQTNLTSITAIASGAAIAIGLILALTGAGLPLGIGLIVAGAAGMWKAADMSGNPMKDRIGNMIDGVKNKWNDFMNWWRNIKWPELSLPHISLPHFSLYYEYSSWAGKALKFLGLPGFPKFQVNWYAKGGVFDRDNVIGVGEYANAKSNPEIVTPQKIMRETVDEANQAVIAAINNKSDGDSADGKMVEMMRAAFAAALREDGGGDNFTLAVQLDSDVIEKKVYKVQKRQGKKYVTQTE